MISCVSGITFTPLDLDASPEPLVAILKRANDVITLMELLYTAVTKGNLQHLPRNVVKYHELLVHA